MYYFDFSHSITFEGKNMKKYIKRLCFVLLFVLSSLPGVSSATSVYIPADKDLWLAGMPDGTWAIRNIDKAPDQSPTQITGLSLYGGEILTFSATGSARHGSSISYSPPDGSVSYAQHELSSGVFVPENGMSNISAPYDSLIGVFLDSNQPSAYSAPSQLLYSIDDLTFSPLLRQVFFIGDGKTSSMITQTFTVPDGATRLFLGTMDTYQWNNNSGGFTVEVTSSVPIPGAILLFAPGLACLAVLRSSLKN
jgi:hypothetical protein